MSPGFGVSFFKICCPFFSVEFWFCLLPAVLALTAATVSAPASFRTSFVDGEVAPVQFVTAQGVDRSIPFGVVAHLDKSEAFGLTSIPVGYDVDTINGTVSRK